MSAAQSLSVCLSFIFLKNIFIYTETFLDQVLICCKFHVVSLTRFKGLDINYGEGGGLQNGKIVGVELLLPAHFLQG